MRCEVLQSFIGCRCGLWDCGACVVGKMAKDVGTAIRMVPSLFGCLFGIPSLHASLCFFCDLFLLFFQETKSFLVQMC